MSPGVLLDRALRTALAWRVLLACFLGAVLAFVAQTAIRLAFVLAGALPGSVAPWESAPKGTPLGAASVYALAALIAAVIAGPLTSGFPLHSAALNLAGEDANLGIAWRSALRTWPAFLPAVAIGSLVSQSAAVLRLASGPALQGVGTLLQVADVFVGLWVMLTMVSIVVSGTGFPRAASIAGGLLGKKGLQVVGTALLLAIPAALLAIAIVALVTLPGLGDILKSGSGLPQTLVTLAIMPAITAFTYGGYISLYVQLTASEGTHEEADRSPAENG